MIESHEKTNEISKRTTPTWEMELLISGATVFSLLQLPAPLYRFLANAGQAHSEAVYQAIKIFGIYSQFSLWILIITFVLHLFMRGYWIALVGMNSVFPQGVQWEKLRGYGPIYKRNLQHNSPGMPELIEIADNRATVVFGLGFGTALTMIVLSLVMGIFIAILLALQMSGVEAKSDDIIVVMLAFFIGPYFVIYVTDKYFGHRLTGHKLGDWFEAVIAFYNRIGFGRSGSVLVNLYRTNQSRGRGYLLFALMAILGATSAFLFKLGSVDGGAYKALPSSSQTAGLLAPIEYYGSLRQEADSQSMQPYIESPVSNGPYLRLFVPYVPRRYNDILQKQCPQALTKKSADTGAGLICLAKLLEISVDGHPVAVELLGSSDPQTGQRGMMAMIPVQALPSGKHELGLVSPRQSSGDEKQEKPHIVRIPFWK